MQRTRQTLYNSWKCSKVVFSKFLSNCHFIIFQRLWFLNFMWLMNRRVNVQHDMHRVDIVWFLRISQSCVFKRNCQIVTLLYYKDYDISISVASVQCCDLSATRKESLIDRTPLKTIRSRLREGSHAKQNIALIF